VVYFALLVEELAVSRVMLNIVFRGHPVVMALLLATICAVILAYLKWGGFRAVLVADFEQLKLLFPFILAIALLSFRSASLKAPAPGVCHARRRRPAHICVRGTHARCVDRLIDRFLFTPQLRVITARYEGCEFAAVSIALTTAIFIVGACYGMMLSKEFSSDPSLSSFIEKGVQYAVVPVYRSMAVIFFASVFCMILSTVNTLTIANFSSFAIYRAPVAAVPRTAQSDALAVILSCGLWPNSVSAVGLFICTLIVIPLIVIIAALSKTVRALFPASYAFLWVGMAISVVAFVLNYRDFTRYSNMPFLGAGVLSR
jgi:hypothetical protein